MEFKRRITEWFIFVFASVFFIKQNWNKPWVLISTSIALAGLGITGYIMFKIGIRTIELFIHGFRLIAGM